MIKKSSRLLFIFVAVLIIVMAFAVSITRLFLPYFEEYRVDIEKIATKELNRPVKVGEVIVDWGGVNPRMRIKNVKVYTPDGSQVWIKFDEVQVYFNVFSSLIHWQLLPGKINIVGAAVDIEYRNDSYYIGGLKIETHSNLKDSKLLNWIIERQKLVLTKGRINWTDTRISPKTQRFTDVDMLLSLKRDYLHFSGTFKQKSKKTNKYRFIVNFENYRNFKTIRTKFFLAGNVQLGQWITKELVADFELKNGDTVFQLWGEKYEDVQRLYGDINIKDLKWRREERYSLDAISANFNWEKHQGGWALNVNNIEWSRLGSVWPASGIYLKYLENPEKKTRSLLGSIKFMRLGDLGQLLISLLPNDDEIRKNIERYSLQGDISNLVFSIKKSEDAKTDFYYKFDFNRFTIQNWIKNLSIEGLSGSIAANRLGGYLKLDSKKTKAVLPHIFSQPITTDIAQGVIQWKKIGKTLEVYSDNFKLKNSHVSTSTKFKLKLEKDKPDFLDLKSTFSNGDISHYQNYLPVYIIKPKVQKWLRSAISGGRLTKGWASYKGILKKGTFNKGDNILVVDFDVTGVRLKYHKNWPAIKNLAANIRFYGKSLTVQLQEGMVSGMEMLSTNVSIPRLGKKSTLSIQGNLLGKTKDLIKFFAAIPSESHKTDFLDRFKASGNAAVGAYIVLPLYDLAQDELAKRKFLGKIELYKSSLKHTHWKSELSNIYGKLNFESEGSFVKLHSEQMSGKYRGKQVGINISTAGSQQENLFETIIVFSATTSFDKLVGEFSNVFHGIITGSSIWKVGFKIKQYVDRPLKVSFKFYSDLKGSLVKLPEGFNKKKNEERIFSVEADITGEKLGAINIAYGNILSGALLVKQKNGIGKLERGEIRFGGDRAVLPKRKEVRIIGEVPSFSVTQWVDWVQKRKSIKGNGQLLLDSIHILDLTFGKLELLGNDIHEVTIKARRKPIHWLAYVSGREIKGEIRIPLRVDQYDPLIIKLDRLILTTKEDDDDKIEVADPRKFPPLKISSKEFIFNDSNYGKLNISASKVSEGLKFDTFSMDSEYLKISAKGIWYFKGNKHNSQFNIDIESDNIGKAIARLKYGTGIKGGKTKAIMRAFWYGPPNWFKMKNVDGVMTVSIRKGRIVDIKPGTGRVLGMLSLQALPRRLTLDFSDLFKKGFSFDYITGRFDIAKGDAYTKDLTMEGPAIQLKINGRIGLAHQDYDQEVLVTPKMMANLPVMGGLAAGPHVGVGLWVANKVLGKQIGKISVSKYSLKGTWQKPIIKRLKIKRKIGPNYDINWADSVEGE